MATHRIAVIAGDGIGPEVTDQAIRVADAAGKKSGCTLEWNRFPWSSAFYKQHGHIMSAGWLGHTQEHDAVLMGAVGSPDVPDTVTVHQLLLPLRRKFDLYVNLRPAYLFHGVSCPLKDKAPGSIDFVVYRENTEGEYAPIGGRLYEGTPKKCRSVIGVYANGNGTHHACGICRSPQAEEKTDFDHKVECDGLWNGILGFGLQGSGQRLSGCRSEESAGGLSSDGLRRSRNPLMWWWPVTFLATS